MITQRLGPVQGAAMEYWQFTVNTEATAAGEKTSAVPLNLYLQDGITVNVDWGDGTTSELTSADYTDLDCTASVHEYIIPGIYTISMRSTSWGDLYLLCYGKYQLSSYENYYAATYWLRRTLISIDSPFPTFSGVNGNIGAYSSTFTRTNNSVERFFWYSKSLAVIPNDLFINNSAFVNVSSLFTYCTSLVSIPSDLFYYLPQITKLDGIFQGCSNLTTIPSDLFRNNLLLTSANGCFLNCSSIMSCSINIYAENITYVPNFLYVGSGNKSDRLVHVKAGTTTESTFNNVSNSQYTVVSDLT